MREYKRQMCANLRYDILKLPAKLIINGEEKDVLITCMSEQAMGKDEYNGMIDTTTYRIYTCKETIHTRQKKLYGWGE